MSVASIFPISAFKDNYIWTWVDEANKSAWVVDPGDAAPVIELLNKEGINLAGILITHHHRDHSGGVEELLQTWGNIPVYGSHKSPVSQITHRVKEGDEINASPFKFKVLEIPGHTLDHVAYFNENLLFSGDTLFSAGCGRVFEGTPLQMYQTLTKLAHLPDNLLLYCGHEYTRANLNFARHVEPQNEAIHAKIRKIETLIMADKSTLPSLLGEEKTFNPFLRCSELNIVAAAEQHAKKKLLTPEEVFTVLREWKNTF